ncbi:hypothetical protein HADU_06739 [Acinetobacter sp. HA]|uniref:hypothetical protein n=1 Tax=Acinetobacter sp. HA TaxID=1173062 RepID=UPI000263DBEB|nr:hypothetical protein [Acinetobacter sp. HA]EIM39523.1 hypothetical protein HADU_06739 [Acinetobacter sp. HA]
MNKFLLLPLALTLSGCLAQAESIEDQPQVDIAAKQYEVQSVNCNQICVATVKADDYNIYVEYALDDGSVEFLDILNVVRHEEAVNAYVDRYEIEKINAAIVGGVK